MTGTEIRGGAGHRSLYDSGAVWLLIAVAPAIYAAAMAFNGVRRTEAIVLAIAIPALAMLMPKSRPVLWACLPFGLLAYAFDIVGLLRHGIVHAERVLACEIRTVELMLFRAAPGSTIGDVLAASHNAFLDIVFAIPYAAFLYVAAAQGVWLYLRDRLRLYHFAWAVLAVHLIGFATWLILPAAPPWYVRAHGCAVDIATAPNPAGLLRVDLALGIHYFRSFYGRAASVFGAMPSLHCALPMVGLLIAWPVSGWRMRATHTTYLLWMIAASVYLDHHWILDGLAGWAAAGVAVLATGHLAGWMFRQMPAVDGNAPELRNVAQQSAQLQIRSDGNAGRS